MPSYDPTLFNVNPYFDDFNEDKKFLRMMFRPGYAVQSRELTQLQTILQNQIERFGNNIFKDGSRIIGGQISTQTLNFVRLLPKTTTNPIFTVSASDIVGYSIIQRDENGNVVAKAKVVDFIPSYSNTDSFGVAIISYLSGTEFSAAASVECDNPDKLFSMTVAASSDTVPHKGLCRVVAVSEGIFYVNGFFVKTDDQIESAYTVSNEVRQFASPTGIMGFNVNSMMVTDKEDYTLKDPANGSYNYNAPGSHRYKIDLELSFTDDPTQTNFVQLVEYLNGEVIKKFDQTQYADLMKLFAQRSYDEKGNFIVKPFEISFREKDETTVNAEIGSGKAYVFGHEYESQFRDLVEIPKARTTAEYTDLSVGNYFGNYLTGRYTPANPSNTNMLDLFGMVTNQGVNSICYEVYGTVSNTGTLPSYYTSGFSGCIFTGLLHKFEIDDIQYSSTQTTGLTMRAYMSNITELGSTGTIPSSGVNLYLFDRTSPTGPHKKLLSNVVLFRDTHTGSNSRMPLFSDFKSQDLVYALNGDTPTTMVKEVEEISYVHRVSRAFEVLDNQEYPSISHGLGSDFNWCFRSGFVPDQKDITLDEDDGYYVVYETKVNNLPNTLPVGTVLKVVGSAAVIPGYSGYNMPQATLLAQTDSVKLTSRLPPGSYRLVGKVKANPAQINQVTSAGNKFRTKTSNSTSETMSDAMPDINTFRRGVKYEPVTSTAKENIYEVYFVLKNADVYRIDSITSGGNDISYKFQFDSGQRDAAYFFGRLYVKPQYVKEFAPGEAFNFTVTYSYFTHSGYGPFLRESYAGISYENIPVFTSRVTGRSINLANAIDFRPVEVFKSYTPTGYIPQFYLQDGFIPDQGSISNAHIAYLPRIDKLVLSRNIAADGDTTTIQRIAGVPGDVPQIPEDLNDSMTMSILSVPAYTFNPKDIKAQTILNNRFTMRDIGSISKRVDNLEQHVVLSDLEASIISKDIKKSDGTDAIKRAILVDTFDGHSVADVINDDHRCSIDIERGELRPLFESHAYDFIYVNTDIGMTLTSDNILCEAYTRHAAPVVQQDKASKTVKINPFGFPNWVGNMKLSPHADFWYEKGNRPVVKYNDTGINDAWLIGNMNSSYGHGSQWNDWESIWTGLSVELTDAEAKRNALFFAKSRQKDLNPSLENKWFSKQGISRESGSFDAVKDIYKTDFRKKEYYVNASTDTIVNRSVVPYVRDNTVVFSAYNLKPNTTVHVFMDNVSMNEYCSYDGVTGGPFVTDAIDGSLENVTMNIPSGTFEVGEKIIRVIDNADNNIADATTISETVFYVEGIKGQNSLDLVSVRQPEIRKQTPNSNKVISTPLYRSKSINTTKYNKWMDPLAQTFSVSDDLYPTGFFAESVDLYIATADTELPITVELCPVVNGLPHTSVILPFSTVVKNPSELNVDSTTPTATTFKFSTPVFLAPGEYAVLVKTNSPRYSVFVAKVGETDLVTDDRISSTLQSGSLFTAQNASEMSGNANTDLMFKLYRCDFSVNTNHTRTFTLNHGFTGEQIEAAIVQPNLFAFTPDDVSLSSSMVLDTTTYPFTNSRNLELTDPVTVSATSTLQYAITATNNSGGLNTFMIDMDRTNVIVVQYIMTEKETEIIETISVPSKPRRRRRKRRRRAVTYTSMTTVDLIEDNPGDTTNDSTSRYISKYVVIPNGMYASELKVYLDANIPKNAFITVFAKAFNSTQKGVDIDYQPYGRMTMDSSSEFYVGGKMTYSANSQDFKEASYTLVPSDEFNTFLVKICMYSPSKTRVPVIKNLRIVAVS